MYYAEAIAWAERNGIVNGVSETEFAPDRAIAREELAAILYRYAAYKGYDATGQRRPERPLHGRGDHQPLRGGRHAVGQGAEDDHPGRDHHHRWRPRAAPSAPRWPPC